MIAPVMLPPSRSFETPQREFSRKNSPRERDEPRRAATLLPWTIKLCLALGFAALGATQYLSRAAESGALRQFARGLGVWGAGAGAARTTLDPCTTLDLRR